MINPMFWVGFCFAVASLVATSFSIKKLRPNYLYSLYENSPKFPLWPEMPILAYEEWEYKFTREFVFAPYYDLPTMGTLSFGLSASLTALISTWLSVPNNVPGRSFIVGIALLIFASALGTMEVFAYHYCKRRADLIAAEVMSKI